jgi:hypothetical protein
MPRLTLLDIQNIPLLDSCTHRRQRLAHADVYRPMHSPTTYTSLSDSRKHIDGTVFEGVLAFSTAFVTAVLTGLPQYAPRTCIAPIGNLGGLLKVTDLRVLYQRSFLGSMILFVVILLRLSTAALTLTL